VPFRDIEGAPFELVPVVGRRLWREVALWWPERRVLVCADALGTIPHYFALGDERIGIHPLLRLTPPRRLGRYDAEHVLVGHGDGVHEGAAAAVRDALAHSRRRLARLPLELAATLRR
jgi:glyoxylase-like metal-dependent hydrolase (beta-lactamase superfamily II)